MKLKRILSLLLAGLMLTGSLAACATDTDGPADTDPAVTADISEDDTAIRDNVPDDLNYDGETVTFISQYFEGLTSGQITVPELKSEPINDAIYERNKYVENRLNVKIVNIEEHVGNYGVIDKVVTAVKSNTGDYDICASPCYAILDQARSGTFANMTNIQYLDLKQPWWSQGLNDAISYKDTQYTAAGHMLLSTYRFAFSTVFNKDMFTNANQKFLYDYVDDGTWTLDKQISLLPVFHRDNGNNQQDEQGDVFGLITGRVFHHDVYFSSCEVDIMTKDEDGEYQFVFDSGKLHEVAEKVLQLYYGTSGATYICQDENDLRVIFSNGYGAMMTIRLADLESADMRNMSQAYGVVPVPRFTEDQDGYYTMLHDAFTSLCIPTTVQGDRLDMVGAVLESMASAGYRIVRPAYYETTLRSKLASDPQSAQMMDMIIEGIRIDAGILHLASIDRFHHVFRNLMDSNDNTVVSSYKSRAKSDQKRVDNLNTRLTALAEKNQ